MLEMEILSLVSGSLMGDEAAWRSGVEIEVARLDEGPEKLNALLNLEDNDARFSATTGLTGEVGSSKVDFPSGEGTSGVCCCSF